MYCHPGYLTYMQSKYIMRNAGLEETQAGIKIAGRNINNLRYADDTTLMAESEEELKSLLNVVGRKVITNLDSILKSRDITLSTKVCLVKAIYCHPAYLTYMQSTS